MYEFQVVSARFSRIAVSFKRQGSCFKEEGWCEEYVKLTYKYWFESGIEAGSEECLNKVSKDMGIDVNGLIEKSNTDTIIQRYNTQTDIARELGIFGSPSFIVNGEIFWGDDRLEDAIKW